MTGTLGVDIAKAKYDVALFINGKYKTKVFENSLTGHLQLLDWLKEKGAPTPHVCMEATGGYGEDLAVFLVDAGLKVSVVNPFRIKGFSISVMSRTKTDKLDAKVIARFCQAVQPEAWTPAPIEQRELQVLVRRLEAVMDLRQQEVNRLHDAHERIVPLIQDKLAALDAQIKLLQGEIRDHIDRHPGLRQQRDLLASIPGIGDATIARFIAEVGDVNRFKNARQLAAFIGLNPRLRQSGTSVNGRARLSKICSSLLRKTLYMPAIVAIRFNPLLKVMYERLRLNGKAKMVAVGALMRKLVHLMYGVLKSGRPFDPEYAC